RRAHDEPRGGRGTRGGTHRPARAGPCGAKGRTRPGAVPVRGARRCRMSRTPQSHLDAAAVNRPLRGRVAIAGAATYGCGEAPGMDDMTLLVRAAHAAVADAGLTMQDID